MIPDYVMGGQYSDRHDDSFAHSALLNATVSFYWRPFFDEDFVDSISKWAAAVDPPYLVHIGK